MVQPEHELAIQNFSGVEFQDDFERQLANKLKGPTELVAEWHRLTSPERMYGPFAGNWQDPRTLESFKEELDSRAISNPKIKNPHTFIKPDWSCVPMHEADEIRDLLGVLGGGLDDVSAWISDWIDKRGDHKLYSQFADYLNIAATRTPLGKYNEVMAEFIQLPLRLRVGWLGLPVEHQDDPFGLKGAPEGLLCYADPQMSSEANIKMGLYRQAGKELFSFAPLGSRAHVASVIRASGFLGVAGRKISGFNIPEDIDVGKKVGSYVVYILPNRIARKNRESLGGALQALCGVESKYEDVLAYTIGHEQNHSYRFKNEMNLGLFRSAEEEAKPQDFTIVQAATEHFDEEELRRVVIGALAFAADDTRKFWSSLTEPSGRGQPSVRELLAAGPYVLPEYILLRRAVLDGAIRKPMGEIRVDRIVEAAKPRSFQLMDLAKGGSEGGAENLFGKMLQEKRLFFFSGIGKLVKKMGGSRSIAAAAL